MLVPVRRVAAAQRPAFVGQQPVQAAGQGPAAAGGVGHLGRRHALPRRPLDDAAQGHGREQGGEERGLALDGEPRALDDRPQPGARVAPLVARLLVVGRPQPGVLRHGQVEPPAAGQEVVEQAQEAAVVLDVLEHVEHAHGRQRTGREPRCLHGGADHRAQAPVVGGAHRFVDGLDQDGGDPLGDEGPGHEAVAPAEVEHGAVRRQRGDGVGDHRGPVAVPAGAVLGLPPVQGAGRVVVQAPRSRDRRRSRARPRSAPHPSG